MQRDTALMSGSIFLNYRRGEDSGFAGRLFDCLESAFSRDQLFMDVDSIPAGLDFPSILEQQVARCDVLLALIGRGWLGAIDEAGQQRLADPTDFVRIEIGSALAQGKRVIPVLVGEATMPRVTDLPEEIKPLARRQAIRLTHEHFKADAERLVEALRNALADAEEKRQRAEAQRKAEELERKRQEQDEAEGRRQAEEKERQWREKRSAEVKQQVAEEEDRRRAEARANRKAEEKEPMSPALKKPTALGWISVATVVFVVVLGLIFYEKYYRPEYGQGVYHRLETLSPSAGASKTDATPAPDVAKTTETLRELQAESKQVDPAELRQYQERVQEMEKLVAELRQLNQQYARLNGANPGNATLQGADSRKLDRVIAQETQVNGEIDALERQPDGSPSTAELDRLKKRLAELKQTYADLLAIYKSL